MKMLIIWLAATPDIVAPSMASIRNIVVEELFRNEESLENIASSNLLTGVESRRKGLLWCLADKIGYKWPIVLVFTILTLAYFTISETANISVLILAMIFYGIAHGIRAVTEWTMLADYTPSETANIATAYLSTIFNIGSALGAITAGALAIFLSIPTIFKLVSIITLTGAFAVTLIQTSDKPS